MIFFNVPEAREELLSKGLVYTLRSEVRKTGLTDAVVGDMYRNEHLCRVKVERVMEVNHPDDLYPYLQHSGFNNTDAWLSRAAQSARTLYRVVKAETKVRNDDSI